MPAIGVLNLSGSVTALPTGTKNIVVPAINSAAASGAVIDINLASGANVISIAPGATAAVILMPSTNSLLVTLKGVSGDTGIAINRSTWTVISFDPTATSFVLTAAGVVNGVEISFI